MPVIELLARFNLLFVIFSQICLGQIHPDSNIDSLLRSGINEIILQNYSNADSIFQDLDKKYPENPLGTIYLAANQITKSVDYGEEISEGLVDSLLNSALDKTEKLLDADDEDLWYNYYEALIHGYNAYFYALSENIISAFADGVLSLRSFQKCLELNEDFYDAFIAIGSYYYWKSAQSESFLWLPFVTDNREKGISYLEKSINSGSYNSHLGVYSLIWIYIDYGHSEKAAQLAEIMIGKYSDSRFFKWGLARAYQDIDKQKAIRVFYDILNSYETLQLNNQFNEIVLRHKIAMLYYEIEDFDNALRLCNEILDFDIKSVKIKKRLHNRIERTKELKESLIEIANN